MDSPRSVQPISGSIPSKQVSNVFLAQVTVSTKSTPLVHALALLDSGANSCFMVLESGEAASAEEITQCSAVEEKPAYGR